MRRSIVVATLPALALLAACAAEHRGPDVSRAMIDAEMERLADTAPGGAVTGGLERADLAAALTRLEAAARPYCSDSPRACRFSLRLSGRNEVNAWISDGRRITFTRGLLDSCASIDEAAFVLAHEMGHAFADHLDETETRAQLGAVALQGALIAAGLLTGFAPSSADLRHMRDLGADLGDRVHSQPQEVEADVIAFKLAAAAGFAPEAGIALFERLAVETPGGAEPVAWLASHPSHAERIVRLRALAAQQKQLAP